MARHLSPTEKEFLIRKYKEICRIRDGRGDSGVSIGMFCRANNISVSAFRCWLHQHEAGGLDALARRSRTLPEVLPEGHARTEAYYKRQILRLRIENERLKKNCAPTSPAGEPHRRPRNTA